MTDTPVEVERKIQPELEKNLSGFGRLSISAEPRTPLVVSEQPIDTELNLRRINIDDGDVSEAEVEPAEEEVVAVTLEMGFFQSMLRSTAKPKTEVSIYEGGLNLEELIDWINGVEKFFDYEETEDEKKVNFVVTKLKGHAALWWDGVQTERKRLGKQHMNNWSRMVAKLRGKFLPSNYQQTLFRQMQNLRQRSMIVKECTEEFYIVSTRAGETQDADEKVARYVNGLRMEIQDEISTLSPKIVEEAYQMALRAEEKLMRKQFARGRGTFQGRGSQGGRGRSTTPKYGASSSSTQHAPIGGDARGRGSFSRGRGGRGRGREVRCYRCNKLGHRAFKCL
eukprot:PITA_24796